MKFNAMRKYEHKVDYYDYNVVQDPASLAVRNEYFFDRVVDCKIHSDGTGRMFLIVPEPLRMFTRVTKIRDKFGQILVGAHENPLGFSYDLTSVDPVTSAFGTQEALRYTLTRSR